MGRKKGSDEPQRTSADGRQCTDSADHLSMRRRPALGLGKPQVPTLHYRGSAPTQHGETGMAKRRSASLIWAVVLGVVGLLHGTALASSWQTMASPPVALDGSVSVLTVAGKSSFPVAGTATRPLPAD